MTEKDFEIKINVPMIKELVSDKIYRSDASAFREQYVNALSHGCVAYHEEHGYTDDVYVRVVFDYGKRMVTIIDNGMGMSKTIFSDNFMSFGFSTVDKETNNTRSGMFGLGAISFFRIASACIVESWDRRTEERFTFMTRNTDESEFVTNRTLEDYGTKTEIFLKEHVRMNTLEDMVRTIAMNYPVKTIVEVVNSEQEQNITTYKQSDEDSYTEFEPTIKFTDYVEKQTEGKYITLIDNDEMELYLSTTNGNRNHTYLCRVPIDISYDSGFTTYLNIKKEKIKGTDSKGRDKLQEVPKPDRDEVNEIAEGYFSNIIEKKCDEMIYDIDIKTFKEFEKSDKRWILNGYSVDDKLNPTTHKFIMRMREPVRYRNENGIQKRHETLLTLFGEYKHIMFHPSLHKGTYEGINQHLRKLNFIEWKKGKVVEDADIENVPWDGKFALVDNAVGMPIIDAKVYKKQFKIKSTVSTGSSGQAGGLLIRDGNWSNYRIGTETEQELNKMYPGGLYYADGLIKPNEICNVDEYGQNKWMVNIRRRHKMGIIISKKAKTIYPSLATFYHRLYTAAQNGKVYRLTRKSVTKKDTKIETYKQIKFYHRDDVKLNTSLKVQSINQYFQGQYECSILPIQCMKSLPMLRHLDLDIVFVPAEFIYGIKLLTNSYGDSKKDIEAISQLKYMPQWKTWNEEVSNFVWGKYRMLFGRYGDPNYKCRTEMMEFIVAIKDGSIAKPTPDEYYNTLEDILSKHSESSYRYQTSYQKMFPELHLEEKAKTLGFEETVRAENENGDIGVWGYTEYKDGYVPMNIGGRYVAVAKDSDDLDDWEAVIDDDGNPQLVKRNIKLGITSKDGKLKFMEEINEWS